MLLEANLGHPTHHSWADDISFVQAPEPFVARLKGHQQVTDAYLLGLATHKKGKRVTMDRAVRALLPDKSSEGNLLILIYRQSARQDTELKCGAECRTLFQTT